MSNKVLIIAEAGVNHNGDVELAKLLIDKAVEAKVDIVKFQTFIAEKVTTGKAAKAKYQIDNTADEESQLDMIKKLELKFDDFRVLKEYAEERNITFLSTPFDHESITFLKSLGVNIGKIPSGEITNLPYLRKMAQAFPELIVSTGMCTMDDVKNAINALIIAGAKKEHITVLHCNTEYPTPMQDVNLKAMLYLGEQLGVRVGYSDHTLGIEVPVAATALGAAVIEKHFTLDRTMNGPDHPASLEPDELKEMVRCIRNIEQALGDGFKTPSESEKKNMAIARKSIVANRDIVKGEIFSEENLTVKRPGTGINPMDWDKIIGTAAKTDFKSDEIITL